MIFSRQRSGPRSFSYAFYLFAVMAVLIAILIINSYFEIQRTRSQLFNILETEGLLVIKGLENNTANLMSALSPDHASIPGQGLTERSVDSLGIEDLLIERLITMALQLDQTGAGKETKLPDRDKQLSGRDLKGVYFLKPDPRDSSWASVPGPLKAGTPFFQNVLSGKSRLAVFRGSGDLARSIALSVAVARRVEPGIILLVLSSDEYLAFSRHIVIQGFLEDFSGKGNIAYLRVEGPEGRAIAQAGETVKEDNTPLIWKREVRSGDSRLFWIKGKRGEFLEILRPFSPAGTHLGLLRLGLSLKEVTPILDQSRRSVIFMGLVLLGLGVISLFLIFRLQGRHIQKMGELEAQIRSTEELSAMGQLAAGVAHEIKNPLNAISLVVQRLEKEFVQPDQETQREYEKFTRIVRSEIARVNQIIGQFLLIARPLATKLEEQSLIEILDYVLDVLSEEIRQRQIRVHKRWGNELPKIRSDRFQLTQAFLNILHNALESMAPAGEIHLQVDRVQGSGSTGRSGKKTDCLQIVVRDTGKGMPPEVLKKIFAPYYTTKEKGVGLGLAITQKIVQSHGGTLEVTSSEDQGTVVTVRLPLQAVDHQD